MIRPGSSAWKWARRACQAAVLVLLVAAPLLGGWQRLDEEEMAAWNTDGRELPAPLYDRLPRGERPSQAYRAIVGAGGGASIQVAQVPAIDPVAIVAVSLSGRQRAYVWLGVALPIVLGLLLGRAFCGWLCPYGTIARILDAVLRRLRWRRLLRVPDRRPVRYALLGLFIVLSVAGAHTVAYLLLPHVLVQQSVYAAWLLGGGSAALGLLGGMVVAGLVFGPTTWCAALCPTGAALGLLGRARPLQVKLLQADRCGSRCGLCDVACWLHLAPASGDPGPDCDLCARCFTACPKVNLGIGASKPSKVPLKQLSIAPMIALMTAGALPFAAVTLAPAPVVAAGEDGSQGRLAERRRRPRLVLSAERVVNGDKALVAVGVVDLTGVRKDADNRREEQGAEVSVFVARPEIGKPDSRGILPGRDWHAGKLTARLLDASGQLRDQLHFDRPRRPYSAVRPTIFRATMPTIPTPGDRLVIDPVDGWFDEPVAFEVPRIGGMPWGNVALWALAGLVIYSGLLAFAFAFTTSPPAPNPAASPPA